MLPDRYKAAVGLIEGGVGGLKGSLEVVEFEREPGRCMWCELLELR